MLKRVTKLPAFDSMELDDVLNSEVMLKCGKEGTHVSLTYNGRASPTPLWLALALSFSGRPRPASPKLRSRSRSGSVYSFYPCRAHPFPPQIVARPLRYLVSPALLFHQWSLALVASAPRLFRGSMPAPSVFGWMRSAVNRCDFLDLS